MIAVAVVLLLASLRFLAPVDITIWAFQTKLFEQAGAGDVAYVDVNPQGDTQAEAAASLKGMSGGVQAGDPMPGEGPWDPIGFSKLHENIQGSEHAGVLPSQQWMREAEIKHGICA